MNGIGCPECDYSVGRTTRKCPRCGFEPTIDMAAEIRSRNTGCENCGADFDDGELVEKLKPRVYEFIEANGPVNHDTMMAALDGVCDCCGEINDRGQTIKEARMQLVDENRIVADVDWNYRPRTSAGGVRSGDSG